MEAVRRQLAEREALEAGSASAWTLHENVSASQLINRGLELESDQYVSFFLSIS